MDSNPADELKETVDRIIKSESRKKLIVAGPGAGKTTLFRKLLESCRGDAKSRLVLTFINTLKIDLEKSLSDLAKVSTLHSYCQLLLHRHEALRAGLTSEFKCLPGLASLIKRDWDHLNGEPAPQFIQQMRDLKDDENLRFYFKRANYYDAVDFDDSVFRVYQELRKDPKNVESYDLVLIDEYQDFNRMEAAFIELLSTQSPIVIAGDDDQALYSQLRGSSWDYIRSLHSGKEYEKFELPFCMRCPEVIVGAVNDIIEKARELKKLMGRIEKPYRHFEPVKGADSKRYPTIALVSTSVQRTKANYWGRYIEEAITGIPKEEFDEANKKGEPAVLIIGAKQYLKQIVDFLISKDFEVSTKGESPARLEKELGYAILNENQNSNLGWRVMLEFEDHGPVKGIILETAKTGAPLIGLIPAKIRERVLSEVKTWATEQITKEGKNTEVKDAKPSFIKATSFEGSKGLSAQHVFIVGIHENELPHDAANIEDIEICRFVVGLTRAKKRCWLLHTGRFADQIKRPSPFLSWIKNKRYEPIHVDARYWK